MINEYSQLSINLYITSFTITLSADLYALYTIILLSGNVITGKYKYSIYDGTWGRKMDILTWAKVQEKYWLDAATSPSVCIIT